MMTLVPRTGPRSMARLLPRVWAGLFLLGGPGLALPGALGAAPLPAAASAPVPPAPPGATLPLQDPCLEGEWGVADPHRCYLAFFRSMADPGDEPGADMEILDLTEGSRHRILPGGRYEVEYDATLSMGL